MKRLSGLQTVFLAVLVLLGSSIRMSGVTAQRDTWMAFLLLGIFLLPVTWIYRCLAAERGPVAALQQSCGKSVGTAFALGYSVLGVLLAADSMGAFSDFVTFTGLAQNVKWIDGVMLGFIVLAMLSIQVEALGRLGRMVIPVVAALFLAAILILGTKAYPARLLPLLQGEPLAFGAYFYTAAALAAPPLFFLAMTASLVRGKKTWGGALGVGSGVAMLLLALDAAGSVTVLGGWLVEKMRYPSYTAMSVAELGKSFQHTELLISAWITLCVPFRIVLYLTFAKQTLTALWPVAQRWYPAALTVLCYVIYLALPLGSMNRRLLDSRFWLLAAAVLLPAIFAAAGRLRRKKMAAPEPHP